MEGGRQFDAPPLFYRLFPKGGKVERWKGGKVEIKVTLGGL